MSNKKSLASSFLALAPAIGHSPTVLAEADGLVHDMRLLDDDARNWAAALMRLDSGASPAIKGLPTTLYTAALLLHLSPSCRQKGARRFLLELMACAACPTDVQQVSDPGSVALLLGPPLAALQQPGQAGAVIGAAVHALNLALSKAQPRAALPLLLRPTTMRMLIGLLAPPANADHALCANKTLGLIYAGVQEMHIDPAHHIDGLRAALAAHAAQLRAAAAYAAVSRRCAAGGSDGSISARRLRDQLALALQSARVFAMMAESVVPQLQHPSCAKAQAHFVGAISALLQDMSPSFAVHNNSADYTGVVDFGDHFGNVLNSCIHAGFLMSLYDLGQPCSQALLASFQGSVLLALEHGCCSSGAQLAKVLIGPVRDAYDMFLAQGGRAATAEGHRLRAILHVMHRLRLFDRMKTMGREVFEGSQESAWRNLLIAWPAVMFICCTQFLIPSMAAQEAPGYVQVLSDLVAEHCGQSMTYLKVCSLPFLELLACLLTWFTAGVDRLEDLFCQLSQQVA